MVSLNKSLDSLGQAAASPRSLSRYSKTGYSVVTFIFPPMDFRKENSCVQASGANGKW